ncbi:helix-turn-helix domain-containing protein [Streptomyces sp. H27-S2]|uniref:helix-turn-helix domain-containing protein n=1 Tax=Streptomyces antarcticus TaxID=2996458 RepID=UPI00226E8C68|nr:XRE family transcriptional regulator [Streptomyces sp. H27-S2]MCY0949509.1 XRE family transcriptional regulator [Streptomyces sp. H27-S2]
MTPGPAPGSSSADAPGSSPADAARPRPADAAGPDELPTVAPQLRELRRRAGLTLEAAAARARLSPAHLSRLETGRRQPSLPLLLGLARTYGTTVSELLGETLAVADPIVRAGAPGAREADGWTYWQAGGSGRGMQALRVHVPYAHGRADLVRVHPGEEWLYVLKGRLRLHLGEAEHLLEPGDSAHFDSLTPHRIAAAGPDGADLLFVHTLLQSSLAGLCLGGASTHDR